MCIGVTWRRHKKQCGRAHGVRIFTRLKGVSDVMFGFITDVTTVEGNLYDISRMTMNTRECYNRKNDHSYPTSVDGT